MNHIKRNTPPFFFLIKIELHKKKDSTFLLHLSHFKDPGFISLDLAPIRDAKGCQLTYSSVVIIVHKVISSSPCN